MKIHRLVLLAVVLLSPLGIAHGSGTPDYGTLQFILPRQVTNGSVFSYNVTVTGGFGTSTGAVANYTFTFYVSNTAETQSYKECWTRLPIGLQQQTTVQFYCFPAMPTQLNNQSVYAIVTANSTDNIGGQRSGTYLDPTPIIVNSTVTNTQGGGGCISRMCRVYS